jgi:hypothetical protein
MFGQSPPPAEALDLPQHLLDLLPTLPALGRRAGAALVTQHIYPTSWRTVGGWPLPWEYPNGRAIAPPESYLRYAIRKARQARTPGRWHHNTEAADAA